ncbi:MAG: FAD-dependent monooxygenase [Geminicoccales bacterium]
MVQATRIAIAGGSIGGLTAACLLRDAGHDVTVFERSPIELEQRGAGIVLLEATARYPIQRAGVDIDDISIKTGVVRYLGRGGRVIHEQQHDHRFSSWTTAYRSLLTAFDRDRYQLDHELKHWSATDEGVNVHFTNGQSTDADLLLCADGIGSMSRTCLQPMTTSNYAGYVAWRGMMHERDLPPSLAERLCEAITYHVMANSHILIYPIPGLDGSVAEGERLINFVWYRNYLEGDELDDLMTDRTGKRRTISLPPGVIADHHLNEVRATAEARLPSDLAKLVLGVEDLFLQVVYDVEIEKMAFGRVCLIGDAAFVARPHAGAGSAKAAEDSWALATALDQTRTIDEALRIWEPKQMKLGRELVARARQIGRRSQVDNAWIPGDPFLQFGLYQPGD